MYNWPITSHNQIRITQVMLTFVPNKIQFAELGGVYKNQNTLIFIALYQVYLQVSE